MIKLFFSDKEVIMPKLDNAKKYYDSVVNPKKGTWCVSTGIDNLDSELKEMTKKDLEQLQKKYDKKHKCQMKYYLLLKAFIKKWGRKKEINKDDYKYLIREAKDINSIKGCSEGLEVYRYGDEVLINSNYCYEALDDLLMSHRMNYSDRIV